MRRKLETALEDLKVMQIVVHVKVVFRIELVQYGVFSCDKTVVAIVLCMVLYLAFAASGQHC